MPKLKDLTGQRFGRLTVLEQAESKAHRDRVMPSVGFSGGAPGRSAAWAKIPLSAAVRALWRVLVA